MTRSKNRSGSQSPRPMPYDTRKAIYLRDRSRLTQHRAARLAGLG